jgi:type IV secretory pathway VirJ component
VIYPGDGGWRDLDKTIAVILARRVLVIGWTACATSGARRRRTRRATCRDPGVTPSAGTPRAMLIGYSFGASPASP